MTGDVFSAREDFFLDRKDVLSTIVRDSPVTETTGNKERWGRR